MEVTLLQPIEHMKKRNREEKTPVAWECLCNLHIQGHALAIHSSQS